MQGISALTFPTCCYFMSYSPLVLYQTTKTCSEANDGRHLKLSLNLYMSLTQWGKMHLPIHAFKLGITQNIANPANDIEILYTFMCTSQIFCLHLLLIPAYTQVQFIAYTAIACYQKGEFCRSENRVRESIQWLQVFVKISLGLLIQSS